MGHGLCSAVYKARSTLQAVIQEGGVPGYACLKQVDVDVQNAPHDIQREIALLQRTRHANLSVLLAAFTDTPDPFTTIYNLVMPLYPIQLTDVLNSPHFQPANCSLSDVTNEDIPWIRLLGSHTFASLVSTCFQQLMQAIAYLHREGIAHRDIKPSNVLFSTDGMLKLIDLGVAWEVNMREIPPYGFHTSDGCSDRAYISDVGSGAFRAPELLFAPKNGYDAFKADIWSLGTVMAGFFTVLLEEETPSMDYMPWECELFPSRPMRPQSRIYHRSTLFDSSSGDITLACDIFKVCGLPSSVSDWPEAEHFQPPLGEFPFMHGAPRESLHERLPNWAQLSISDTSPAAQTLQVFVQKIFPTMMQLSASKRPSIDYLVTQL